MGYSISFTGQFNLNKKLDKETHTFLKKLSTTRRMKRNVDPKYGTDGEFYFGKGDFGQDREANIIDYNKPPSTQPGLWCQWTPTKDGKAIIWDGSEKFYNYIKWIQYIIDKVLSPKNYSLTGEVEWQGEYSNDSGIIKIEDNKIKLFKVIICKEVK